MTAQALHSCLQDLSMFFSDRVTDPAIQYSWNVFLVGKRNAIDLDLGIFKTFMAFAALCMGNLRRLGQGDGSLGMAFRTRGLLPLMAFETGLFRRPKGRWIVRIMVDIVVAGGARVFQLLNVETVGNGYVKGIDFGRSRLHI